MHRKSTREAAGLLLAASSGQLAFAAANAERGAQAFVTRDGDLVIPGTNEHGDWTRFNIDVLGIADGPIPGLALVPVSQIGVWHNGFLRHADSVYRFARHHRPRFIVGHSLGGAAAQIIGHRMRIPTITFGAPRVYRGRTRPLAGEGWVLNLCRSDDPVTGVPEIIGFRHLGTVRRLDTGGPVLARNHPMAKYLSLIGEDAQRFAQVEREWPRVA